MKSKFTSVYVTLGALLMGYFFLSFADNPPNGLTGAPGEGLCTSCHSPASPTTQGHVAIQGLPGLIMPNTSYSITVTLTATAGSPTRAGFQLVALNSSNQNAGTMLAPGPFVGFESSGGRNYAEHRPARPMSGGTATFTFTWLSPVSPPGDDITMYVVGNLANGNNTTSGDRIVTSSFTGTLQGGAPPLNVNILTSQNVSCFGGNNGSATASASGGTPPYSYLWSSGATSATANNLSAGTHTVTVSDGGAQMATAMVNVTQPPQLVVNNVSQTNIDCDHPNGSATVSAAGGTPAYFYSWSNGENSPVAINLPAGNNTVTVTDFNGCMRTGSVFITSNTIPPVANAGPNMQITCNNPQVQLNGTGSASGPSIFYQWSTGNGHIVSGANTATPIVDAPGLYRLTVENTSSGCTATSEVVVTQNITVPIADAGPDRMLTCSSPTVTADGSGSSQGANLTYLWTTTNGDITSGANTLTPVLAAAGEYVIKVTNTTNGCEDLDTMTVTSNINIPVADAGEDKTLNCLSDTLILDGSGSSQGADILYLWEANPGHIIGATDNPLVTVDSAGIYILTVTNQQNGCASTDSIIVNVDTIRPIADAGPDFILHCMNLLDTLDGTASSMGARFRYSWNASGGNIISGDSTLTPVIDAEGSYVLTVEDTVNGCSGMDTTAVVMELSPEIAITDLTNNDCFGEMAGSVTVDITNGIPPISIAWSNGADGELNENLSAGTYSVTVVDGNGCMDTAMVTITEPAAIMANVGATGVTVSGANDGTAFVSPVGGTPTYSITWSNGSNNDTIWGLSPGNYPVTIEDSNGCLALDTAFVNDFDCIFSGVIRFDSVSCNGGNDGAAYVQLTGGIPPFEFEWSNGGFTDTIHNLTAGNYSVTITDQNNCVINLGTTVLQPSSIQVAVDSFKNVSCFGGNNGNVSVSASGGVSGYSFSWSNGNQGNLINGLAAGVYTVTVTDRNDCEKSLNVMITEPGMLMVELTATNVSMSGGNDGTATASVDGGSPPYDFQWSTGAATSVITDLIPSVYHITVTDFNGCSVTDSIEVFDIDCSLFAGRIEGDSIICPGSDAGGLTAIPGDEGMPPFTFEWSDGSNGQTLADIGAGTYMVTITDAVNCSTVDSFMIVEKDDEPPLLTCSGNIVTGNCSEVIYAPVTGMDNCSIVSIELTEGFASGEQFPEGLTTVTYTGTDAAGNTATCSFDVTVDNNLELEVAIVDKCDSVAVNAIASGGTAPYDYLWSNDSSDSGTTFFESGQYSLTLTDVLGCSTDLDFTANIADPVEVQADIQPETSIGNNGSIQVTVSGGTGGYTFEWKNEEGNEVGNEKDLEDVSAGDYSLLVTDDRGCSFLFEFTIPFITHTNDYSLENAVNVFPNPADESFRIGIEGIQTGEKGMIKVFSLRGEEVTSFPIRKEQGNPTINTQAWANGVYIVKIIIDGNATYKRMVIGH